MADTTPSVLNGTGLSFRQLIEWIAKFVGIAGGGTAGFAAAAFGIGYLATKSHDTMLGLPTTTSAYDSYVRAGALFFSNSLYYLVAMASDYIWKTALPVLVLVVLVSWLLPKVSVRVKPGHKLVSLAVMYAIVGLLAFLSAERLVSVIHPDNKGLLLKLPDEVHHRGYERAIYESLRKEGGEAELQRIYSIHLAQTLGLICLAVILSRFRRNLYSGEPANQLKTIESKYKPTFVMCDWVLRPLVYILIFFHVALLPTNYGVLCISNEYPRVFLTLKEGESPKKAGFLLSDMSVEVKEIVWLTSSGQGQLYTHNFYDRVNIKEIKLMSFPGHRNILYVADSTDNQ